MMETVGHIDGYCDDVANACCQGGVPHPTPRFGTMTMRDARCQLSTASSSVVRLWGDSSTVSASTSMARGAAGG